MEKRELGKSGIMVTPMTVGSWESGGGSEWGQRLPDSEYVGMMRAAFEQGVNFVDSAVYYGFGHAMEVIGQAIKGLDREKIVIATKQVADGLRLEKIDETVQYCLSRLSTDYIDVFLVHWPHPEVDIAENMEALMRLKEKGIIRAIGVSNYTLSHLQRAVQYAQVDVLQPCYSIFWRKQLEEGILPFCVENNIGIMTYSSIAMGLLSSKFLGGKDFLDPDDQRVSIIPLFSDEIFPAAQDAAKRIAAIGEKYGKTQAQTAVNWVAYRPGITTAMVGAKTAAEITEDIGGIGWQLSPEDRKAIGDIGMEIASTVSDWDTLFQKDHPMLKVTW